MKTVLSGKNIENLGIDTSPFIYFIENHPEYGSAVREVFAAIDSGSLKGFTSVITLTELLSKPLHLGQTALVAEYRVLLETGRHFKLIPIDSAIAYHAAELRQKYALRTPDALQIASALAADCDAFLTNDKKLAAVKELDVLVLKDLI